MTSVVILARYRFPGPPTDADLDALRELAALSRAEPGNVSYEVTRSIDDERLVVLDEVYIDAEAVAAHRASEHFRRLVLDTLAPRLESREARTLVDLDSTG